MRDLTDQDHFNLSVEEARDRLSSGIAESVEEVVEQLIEEGLIPETDRESMKNKLEMP